MQVAANSAALARFRADLESLTGKAPTPEARLGVAVSGGPDSMALLLLAASAYPGAVVAATVNHGLRPEAAEEAALVAATCARLGVPHALLVLPPQYSFTGNLQEQARGARYFLLHQWARGGGYGQPWHADWVAVAHHADDVAETFLMRARRGSGVGGLAAMRRVRPLEAISPKGLSLVRPLLDWRRDELAALIAAAGIPCAHDPSNQADRFDRSRIRKLLAATPDLPPERLARAAQNLRHAEDALETWVVRELSRFEEDEQGDLWLDPADLPYELRRRFLHRAIDGIRMENGMFDPWRVDGLDRLLATLDAGKTGTIAGVQGRAIGGRWHFRPAPPRRTP